MPSSPGFSAQVPSLVLPGAGLRKVSRQVQSMLSRSLYGSTLRSQGCLPASSHLSPLCSSPGHQMDPRTCLLLLWGLVSPAVAQSLAPWGPPAPREVGWVEVEKEVLLVSGTKSWNVPSRCWPCPASPLWPDLLFQPCPTLDDLPGPQAPGTARAGQTTCVLPMRLGLFPVTYPLFLRAGGSNQRLKTPLDL